jgi:DUF4097 and DUF4098 domain-containing protein YvlB
MTKKAPFSLFGLAAAVLLTLGVSLNTACVFIGEDGSFFGQDYKHKQEMLKTYPLTADGSFSLKNTNGLIRISSWDRAEVEIKAEKAAVRESDLDRIEIKIDAKDKAVSIDTIYPRLRFFRARVNYEVKVPAGARLETIRSTNGDVELTGRFGEVKAGTTNGDVRLDGATGKISLSTTNGDIQAQNITGRLEADTTNGKITLEVPKLESDIDAGTTNGSIHLRLGADPNARLSAHTTNGHITVDFPITVQGRISSRRRVEGTIGNGGPAVSLKTTNGSITIGR